MKIKSESIDRQYFLEDIKSFMKKNKIRMQDIINITEDDSFITIWYWSK